MRSFEENHARWIDGEMTEDERRAFEAGLTPEQRDEARRWSGLRKHLAFPTEELPHPEFFQEQIRRRMVAPSPPPGRRPLALGWLVWSGAACLLTALALGSWLLPAAFQPRSESDFFSQVVEARSANPEISAYAFQAPTGRGAVIWTEGSRFIPAEESVR